MLGLLNSVHFIRRKQAVRVLRLPSSRGRMGAPTPNARAAATAAAAAALQVTSYKMALNMEAEVIGGPTAEGQPVFEWGNNWAGFEHRGMPDR